jgi:hypothetical protein
VIRQLRSSGDVIASLLTTHTDHIPGVQRGELRQDNGLPLRLGRKDYPRLLCGEDKIESSPCQRVTQKSVPEIKGSRDPSKRLTAITRCLWFGSIWIPSPIS